MTRKFFTVGPTEAHPKLGILMQGALKENIPSISHRSAEFQSIFERTTSSIRRLLDLPKDFHVFFLGSATEAMERIIENCAERNSFHFVNGSFSKRFLTIVEELKKQPEKREATAGEGFDLKNVRLPRDTELVCLTQNETSTGVAIRMNDIHALKKRYPEAIFAIDIVSSTPYVRVDYSLIDCTFFSVQKGFGMPAGLGVLLVNDRCIEKSRRLQEKGLNIGTYHNFPTLLKYALKNQTPETPNVLGIYLLGRIADMYNEYGIDRIRKETDEKAHLIYDFFEDHSAYSPFVKNPAWRSKTVIAIETPGGSEDVRTKLRTKGFVVGAGYGEYKDKHIRIGNFPVHSVDGVEKLLRAIQ